MMHTLVLLVLNLLCLSALFWFFDIEYRRFRVDLLRFHLFGVRDELFAAAADGKIGFDSAGYGMTRQTLNGMIRFAHETSLWRMLVMMATHSLWTDSTSRGEYSDCYDRAKASLTPEQTELIESLMQRAHFVLFSHMLHTSLLTFPIVIGVKLVLKAISAAHRVNAVHNVMDHTTDQSVLRPVLRLVDCEAYAFGDEVSGVAW